MNGTRRGRATPDWLPAGLRVCIGMLGVIVSLGICKAENGDKTSPAAPSKVSSPDGRYAVVYRPAEAHESDVDFIRTSDRKVLFTGVSSGVGGHGYLETRWSPDSRYLAVAVRGTKTTVDIELYRFDGHEVTRIEIPDYRLNLLGRHQLTQGGRYRFAGNLSWDEKHQLTFSAKGSLVDGADNPKDSPANWYHYQVTLDLSTDRARLSKVTPLPLGETIGVPAGGR